MQVYCFPFSHLKCWCSKQSLLLLWVLSFGSTLRNELCRAPAACWRKNKQALWTCSCVLRMFLKTHKQKQLDKAVSKEFSILTTTNKRLTTIFGLIELLSAAKNEYWSVIFPHLSPTPYLSLRPGWESSDWQILFNVNSGKINWGNIPSNHTAATSAPAPAQRQHLPTMFCLHRRPQPEPRTNE